MKQPVDKPDRNARVVSEMTLGIVYRFLSMAAYAVSLSVLLNLLGHKVLGVWLVISAAAMWIQLYDLGIASGARNEIARAAATNNVTSIQQAVATGWFYSAIIAAALFAIFSIALAFGSTQSWIRLNIFDGVDGSAALWVAVAGSCVTLVLRFAQTAFAALERASYLSLSGVLSGWMFVAALLCAPFFGPVGLLEVAVLHLISACIANLLIIGRFAGAYPQLRWRLSHVDHQLRHVMLGFGLRLFVVQIAAMIILFTDSVLVSAFVGPAEVVVYDAGLKIFSIVTMIHAIALGTLWSTFTQAHARKEWDWIRATLRKLVWLMVPIGSSVALLAFLSPTIVRLWLDPTVAGSLTLYGIFAVVAFVICWSNNFAYYLNGIGDVTLQFRISLVVAPLNIPMSYFFAVLLEMGTVGVLLGTLASLSIFAVAGPISVYRQLKAVGGSKNA